MMRKAIKNGGDPRMELSNGRRKMAMLSLCPHRGFSQSMTAIFKAWASQAGKMENGSSRPS